MEKKEIIKPDDIIVIELNIPQVEYNKEKEQTMRRAAADKYGVPLKNVKVVTKYVTINEEGERVNLVSDVIDNVQDARFQVRLLERYLKENKKTDIDFNIIKDINSEVDSHIDFTKYAKYKAYKFKYIRWSNFMSYGADNYVDFTKLHGLVLISSIPGNQGGKTTFATELLRFALFGTSEKPNTLNSMFNLYLEEATELFVEAGIEIDGEDYVIRRTVSRPSKGRRTKNSKATQKVEYFKRDGESLEDITNCVGENGKETNAIIRESVGTIDDYRLVVHATERSLTDLIEMGKTDKGRLFSRWLGLLSIEEKEVVAKDLWKKSVWPSMLSAKYDRGTLTKEIEDLNTVIRGNQEKIDKCKEEEKNISAEVSRLTREADDIIAKKRPVRDGIDRYDAVTVAASKKEKEEDIERKRAVFAADKERFMSLKDITIADGAEKKNREEAERIQQDIIKEEGLKAEYRTLYTHKKEEIEKAQALIGEGVCPHCGQKVDGDMQGRHIEELKREQQDLIDKGRMCNERLEKLSALTTANKQERDAIEKAKEDISECTRLKLKLTATKENIERLKVEIEGLKKTLKDIEENEDVVKHNNAIDIQVGCVRAEASNASKKRDAVLSDIRHYEDENKNYKKEVETRESLVKGIEAEEPKVKAWNAYLELIGKNGIVKMVLREVLPIINKEMARLLDGLVDFRAVLSINDKNDVEFNLTRDGVEMDYRAGGSGYEKIMGALALRTALSNIGSMPHPNCLVLDEADGPVNPENAGVLRELYERILSGYDFILHILHTSEFSEQHDMYIDIIKENNISKIRIRSNTDIV